MQVRGVRTLNVDLVSFDQEFKKSNYTKKTSMNDKKNYFIKASWRKLSFERQNNPHNSSLECVYSLAASW